MIFIIDYGMGNLFSVNKALASVGAPVKMTSSPEDLKIADAVVLPGVGNFGEGMKNLSIFGLDKAIKKFVKTGKPLLGICLGMQLLMEESEEAPGQKGLGIFKGAVIRFPKSKLKVPQMGWNSVKFLRDSPFTGELKQESYFYFVHSYYVSPNDPELVVGETEYGLNFCSAIGTKNIFATQFHPEKSQNAGLQILKNFVGLVNAK
ncbi:MAG TPA: imidazole glycerol phosphate synthase subunit HisH [Victivallales bacterium]|nr:imidazole glycerol phosphate synthase subunit HisH [Victivallales bacterium]